MPPLVGDIEKKMGLHQGKKRMSTLGVPNKAVSSTSVQMSPVLTTAALGPASTQGLPQVVKRQSFWLGAAQLVVWFLLSRGSLPYLWAEVICS